MFAWPKYFPAGCPPAVATSPTGERVYRLGKNVPPTSDDFIPLGVAPKWPLKTGAPAWPACGLFVEIDPRGAGGTPAVLPGLPAPTLVQAALPRRHGLLLDEPSRACL